MFLIIIQPMDQKIYHGDITPEDFSRDLIGYFQRGNLRVQQIGLGDQIAVQIATSEQAVSGGKTALSISLRKVEDGVSVQVGQQTWLGVAASLGYTAFAALRNPFSLLNRLDDLAQDVENLQISDDVWKVLEATARAFGSGTELSNRLKRYVCDYCNTANPTGEPRCIACGAPLGEIQPGTCKNCGFVISSREKYCPNCKKSL
jgi:hypothetical protein